MDHRTSQRLSLALRRGWALAALGALASSCGSGPAGGHDAVSSAPTVATAPVRRTDLRRVIVLPAEFRPYEEIDVHAKVAGYVKQIFVDVGDHVKTGELLATLEIPEMRDEAAQADAAVRQATSEVQRAKSDLDRAESAHDMAHSVAARLAAVAKSQPGLVAQQEIEDAAGRDRVSEAQVATAKAALETAQQQVQVSEANRARVHTLYGYANITAPFDGVITRRYADTGSMIQAGTASQTQTMPIVRLSRNAKLRLVIAVPESVVSDVHPGTAVRVQVKGSGKTIDARVDRVADQLDTATRTMRAEADIENPSLDLVPGVYADVTIVLSVRPHALAVPVEALTRAEDRVTVMIVKPDHTLEERAVQLGLETADEAEVLSGVAEGDLVVVGNRSQLKPGQTVQPAAAGGR